MRPNVRRLDSTTETHITTPTKAKAVTRLLFSKPFSIRGHISATSRSSNQRLFGGQGFALVGAADQGNGAAADHHRTDGRQHRDRAAVQRGHDVLLRGHRK